MFVRETKKQAFGVTLLSHLSVPPGQTILEARKPTGDTKSAT